MSLKEYFESKQGVGVLSTSDKQGKVDSAIYGRPHFIDESQCAFIMSDRLSHKNLQENPHAAYLFMEQGPGYEGKRLSLVKIKETDNQDLIEQTRRNKHGSQLKDLCASRQSFLVYFEIREIRPLAKDRE